MERTEPTIAINPTGLICIENIIHMIPTSIYRYGRLPPAISKLGDTNTFAHATGCQIINQFHFIDTLNIKLIDQLIDSVIRALLHQLRKGRLLYGIHRILARHKCQSNN